MYFKRLEIVGFKSFAEKTTLNFEPGVTAIVGPNGCGKSNVADAMRWALGEQSTKSMRASSMQDVIFNGTDTKEPINFAEVSLTLSNEKRILPIDYDEVTITRRIFRSGENEYLLNKTPVRLKDISELLMGTGIGTESYSIIEQGKMDLILSSRPEDRRFVFEEASGITKYKSKKKEALRKLEETENNLLRINDIIQEVKRQISSIERQAKKAQRYKVELEKMKDLELRLSSYEYRALRSEEVTKCAERDDAKGREKELLEVLNQMNSKCLELRGTLDTSAAKIAELKNRNVELLSLVDKNAHKIEVNEERIREAETLSEGLAREIESTRTKLAAQREMVEKLKGDAARLSEEKETKAVLVREKDRRLTELSHGIAEGEKTVKASKLNTMEFLAQETQAKNELIKLGTELATRSARERRLALEKSSVTNELARGQAEYDEAKKVSDALEEKVKGLTASLETSRRDQEAVGNGMRSLEEELNRLKNEEASLKSKAEFLEDLVKRHEGFSAGVKFILSKVQEDPSCFTGVVGAVADLIEVERGFEEAVGAVLGDEIQTVVANTLKDAVQAIAYLRENKLGRASFVSREELKALAGASLSQDVPGLTPLGNFVKIDPQYREIADYFFGNTYLVESLEDAAQLSKTGCRFVTKMGMVLHRGMISGGSIGDKEESLIVGRRERLADLKRELEAVVLSICSQETARSAHAGSLEQAGQKMKEIEQELRQEEIGLANAVSRKGALEENVRRFREELVVVDLELDEIQHVVSELKVKEAALKVQLSSVADENAKLQHLVEEITARMEKEKDEKAREALAAATLKAQLVAIEKERVGLDGRIEKETTVEREEVEQIAAKEGSERETAGRRDEHLNENVALAAENIALERDLSLFSQENAKLEAERSGLAEAMRNEESQLKEKTLALEELRNQARDIEMKVMDLNYRKTSLKERMLSAYKVDLDTFHTEAEEHTDWESIRSVIQELRAKLDDMGAVNLVAIDEHKELEERYSFLTHQQEDLVNAKESLHKAIAKINKTTKELFTEVFQKIQLEFKNFFRMLFGGGQAELLLMDEQDVLECGIEIVARPPGKKLQNIMLLSGGEKALTAIALLFAIFKVKPSPFCVLDEIDAPLDESNVGRFAGVLQDFLKMSQFIIITHNKKTIELADVMYGITMQERGVSKIVSVKFLSGIKKDEEKPAAEVYKESPQEEGAKEATAQKEATEEKVSSPA